MLSGRLIAIYVGAKRRADMQPVDQVEAVAGRGLSGDRFFRQVGIGNPRQEVTLIESESLEALMHESNIELKPSQSRRNLLTQGIRLNDLVKQEFMVGEVRLRGIMLCEPCRHLEALTTAGIKQALRGRGGLRAEVVQGGWLQTGNAIYQPPVSASPSQQSKQAISERK